MPKIKKPLETTRTRRQASKEALKQLQLLLDDDDEDAFVIPDDEDSKKDVRLDLPPPPKKRAVSPVMESSTPKKKYKLSHRKSSDGNDRDVIVLKSISNSSYVSKENTLELECFVEELSEVQKRRQKEVELEEKELQTKLDELLKSRKAEIVFTGGISSAVEVNELISNCGTKSIFNPNDLPEVGGIGEQPSSTFQLVMDPRLGIIVGSVPKSPNSVQIAGPAVTKGKLQISSAVKAVATLSQSTSPPPTRTMRSRRSVIATPSPTTQTRTNSMIPNRANSLGVMTRGNATTPRPNNSLPSKGVPQITSASPTIQTRGMKTTPMIQTRNNKTTPTTSKRPVVNVPAEKPKQVVDLTSEDNRNQADNREISFNKLQGKTYPSLVVVARPHLRVTDLAVDRPKLDSKVKSVLMHPPTKFTEWLIQQGVIRAEQKCPVHSNTQLKLGMYSDVTKFPFSGGYVWISECCPQRFVSVFNGSIFEGSPHPPVVMLKLIYHWSCQTNIQNVTQWVKVDNLYVKGVYTWLRGVCTLAVQSRIRQLGSPGSRIEVGVISLGTTSHDGNQRQVKVEVLGVLESTTKYVRLRAVEPMPDGDRNFKKKFSKILEPILHWVHPGSTIVTDLTVDKATLNHMGFTNVVQTTSNDYSQSNRTIMEYLRRIVPRMFQNTLSLLSRQIIQQFLDELVWREWFGITSQMAFDNIITHLAEQTRINSQTPLVLKLNKVAANPFRSWNNGSISPLPSNNSTPTPTTPAPSTTVVPPAKSLVAEVKKYGRGKKSSSPQVQVVQERPTKPVSPDVPEQMVPLENYYYGTIDPMETTQKIILNMKCPFCKSSFDNNILLQNHLFKHAHNVSNDAYLCRYCLTSVSTANELIHHVNKCHPGGTKFDYGFVCLICEIHYMNPFVLGKHMSKEHIPHELPYQCGSCSYRCSNHKQVIDHFYVKHDGGSTIQCPFCLKSTTVWSSGRNVAQNIHYFIQHLQKHQKKQFAKRCGKCNLWFVQKEVLKEHQQKMHISLRGKIGLIPYFSPRNGVMVPKSKMDKNPCDAEVINFPSLYYNISTNSTCKECNQTITSSKHFPSFDNCQNPNCQYSTCCAIAMMTHNAKCKGLNSVIPPEILPFEMFCVCGFRDSDGNSMAKHLALCEKKSAYPSEADAKSATVMHSMLDILGLVRKPEENKNEKASNSSNIDDKTEATNESSGPKKDKFPIEIDILSDEEMVSDVIAPNKANDPSVETDLEDTILAEIKSTVENTDNKDKIKGSENTSELLEDASVTADTTNEYENAVQRGIGDHGMKNKNNVEQTEEDNIINEESIVSPNSDIVENIEESNNKIDSRPEDCGNVFSIKQTEEECGITVDITNKQINLSESGVRDQTELVREQEKTQIMNNHHDDHKQGSRGGIQDCKEGSEINEPGYIENMKIGHHHHEGQDEEINEKHEEDIIEASSAVHKVEPNQSDHSKEKIRTESKHKETNPSLEHHTVKDISEKKDTIQTDWKIEVEQDNQTNHYMEIDSIEKPRETAFTQVESTNNGESNNLESAEEMNEIMIIEDKEQALIEGDEKNDGKMYTESFNRNEIDPLTEDLKLPINEKNITNEFSEGNHSVENSHSMRKEIMLKRLDNEDLGVEVEHATGHNDEQTESIEIHIHEEASTQLIKSCESNNEQLTENIEIQASEKVLSQQTEHELNENKISQENSTVFVNEDTPENETKTFDEDSNTESECLQASNSINDILSSADNILSENSHSTGDLSSMEVD